jgi:hypothetical protein
MTFFSTLRTRWASKLALFLIGGAVLHFAPGLFVVVAILAAIALVWHYRQAHHNGQSLVGATGALAARLRSTANVPAEAAQRDDTLTPAVQVKRSPKARFSRPDSAHRLRYTLSTADEVEDDGYRCFEHGLNHDCPLEDR